MALRLLLPLLVAFAAWPQTTPESTPESAIRGFVSAISAGDLRAAAQFVENSKDPDKLAEFEKSIPKGALNFTVTNLVVTGTGDDAKVTFELTVIDSGRTQTEPMQTLTLHRTDGVWRIVQLPVPLQPAKGQELAYFATVIGNPEGALLQAKAASQATACLSNLKQLALTCMMFLTDYDDKFLLSTAKLQSKLMPYSKNEAIFSCKESGKPYSFNDNLTGLRVDTIKDPSKVVMVYEGAKGVLNFRHEGRAGVGFADGHVKLVGREAAKTLLWK
jgi:prepilin-type processing-associated H-X9-DG protein